MKKINDIFSIFKDFSLGQKDKLTDRFTSVRTMHSFVWDIKGNKRKDTGSSLEMWEKAMQSHPQDLVFNLSNKK